MNKILELSKPKGNTVDEKKEKSELINEIKQREEDAAEFINKLYKTNEAGTINEYVTSIESLDFVKKQIEQLKVDLQSQIKDHNDVHFRTKDEQMRLSELQNQLHQLEIQNQG